MEETPRHPESASTASESTATGPAKDATVSESTATGPAKDATVSESTATGPAKDTPATRRIHWIFPTFVGVLLGVALALVICSMPAAARTFVGLSAVAGVLIVGGLVTLIVLIPAAGSNPDVKTEFFSARAAYFCVIAGLGLFGIVAIGAIFARVMLTVGGH
jgi:hypothetical protein